MRRSELLCALLLGDRSGLSSGDRQLLRETGTAHLLAISGLHVGMVTGFFLLLGKLLGRLVGLATGATPRGWRCFSLWPAPWHTRCWPVPHCPRGGPWP
ncbi:ComEC/Rec2 family competence protein [Microbulbifer taiwanensis]|uniref:ComEC/Rec2 family competence protein n=1 Tax=Microbulbifer taiwanensis TaxID=986746 RepID=UPI00361F4E6B